jgi:hypothetical protein
MVDIDDVGAKVWIHFCREKVEVLGVVGEVADHPCIVTCQRYVEIGTNRQTDKQTNRKTEKQRNWQIDKQMV